MISQKTVLKAEVAGKSFELYCDNDSPLGSLHDALMQMKGWSVDRMRLAQQEESEAAEKLKSIKTENEAVEIVES